MPDADGAIRYTNWQYLTLLLASSKIFQAHTMNFDLNRCCTAVSSLSQEDMAKDKHPERPIQQLVCLNTNFFELYTCCLAVYIYLQEKICVHHRIEI